MKSPSFVIEQLEEALEERQGSDRRKQEGQDCPPDKDRRVSNRRENKQSRK